MEKREPVSCLIWSTTRSALSFRRLKSNSNKILKKNWGSDMTYSLTGSIPLPICRSVVSWNELREAGQLEHYYTLLLNNFNPLAVDGLMCRSLLSVGWDGRLYDCDFNQMLDMPVQPDSQAWIGYFNLSQLERRPIVVGPHCFGCTAGSGSSCGGALT